MPPPPPPLRAHRQLALEVRDLLLELALALDELLDLLGDVAEGADFTARAAPRSAAST